VKRFGSFVTLPGADPVAAGRNLSRHGGLVEPALHVAALLLEDTLDGRPDAVVLVSHLTTDASHGGAVQRLAIGERLSLQGVDSVDQSNHAVQPGFAGLVDGVDDVPAQALPPMLDRRHREIGFGREEMVEAPFLRGCETADFVDAGCGVAPPPHHVGRSLNQAQARGRQQGRSWHCHGG
jgi:hypothetical protein